MKKRVLLACLAVLLLAGITASASMGKVTLRYYMWDPEIQKVESVLIKEFEKRNPNIKVEMTVLEPTVYWPKISGMAAAGQLPDVISMSSGYFDQWAKDGLLLNLTDFVKRDLNPRDYFLELFSTNRYPDKVRGNIYATPYAWVTTVLFYNKDMFDAAGVQYPNDDWTWDDFLKAAQKLTVRDSKGTITRYGYWWYGRYAHVEPWIFANGGDLLNPNRTRVEFDKNAREALQFLSDLATKYKVSPAFKDVAGIRQQDMFPLQQAAMWIDGSWNVGHVRDMVKDSIRWGIAKVPRGPSASPKDYRSYYWPDSIAISSNTKYPEAAWQFVKFLIGPDRPVSAFMGGKVPIYKPTAASKEWLQEDQQPGNFKIILELGDIPGKTSFTIGWSEWRGYAATGGAGMNGELDKVTNGEQTLTQALERVTKYGNDVLKRYYPAP